MDGQTNGLPVGNAASHFAAELILKDVDQKLSEKLSDIDFVGFRFRDDYKFLTRTRDASKRIIRTLDQILQEHYGMHLNDSKTDISDDIIGNCYRPWKSTVRNNALLSQIDQIKTADDMGDLLQKYRADAIFLAIYEAQKSTPLRLAPALLEKIASYLRVEHCKYFKDRLYAIESILESIVNEKEASTPQFVQIISVIVKSLETPSAKQQFLNHVVRSNRLRELSEQQLTWMYRMLLTFSHENLIPFDHPLIKVLGVGEYECDSAIFDNPNEKIANELEEKFTLIDRQLLGDFRNKEITKRERDVFYI
jgi:hypothetical protein